MFMAEKYCNSIIWLLKATFFFGTEATGQLSRLLSFPFGRESGPILGERRVSLLAVAHYNYGILSWGCQEQDSSGSSLGEPARRPTGRCPTAAMGISSP